MKPVVPRFLYAQHAWYLLMLVFCSYNMQTTCWFPFSLNLILHPRSKSHVITYSNDHYDYFRSAVFHVAPKPFLLSSPPLVYHQLHYPRGLALVIPHISIRLVHLIPLVFFYVPCTLAAVTCYSLLINYHKIIISIIYYWTLFPPPFPCSKYWPSIFFLSPLANSNMSYIKFAKYKLTVENYCFSHYREYSVLWKLCFKLHMFPLYLWAFLLLNPIHIWNTKRRLKRIKKLLYEDNINDNSEDSVNIKEYFEFAELQL